MAESTVTIVGLARRVLASVFGPPSWDSWMVLLQSVFGLPLSEGDLEVFERLTGRSVAPSTAGVSIREAWFICGRRAGKSIIAALIAVFCCTCRSYVLAPGEVGTFMIIAADRRQARVIARYAVGLLESVPVLSALIAKKTATSITFTNGIVLEIHTASFRVVRGYTLIGVVADELAFWPTDDSANPDTEILGALRPAMATVPGALLIGLTSPYSRRGETWKAYRTHFGRSESAVLVAVADTKSMNPTVPDAVIAQAYEDDPSRAAAEYGAQFRSDLESYISDTAIDAVTVPGRLELPPVLGLVYRAGYDAAGGSGQDETTIAIAHDEPDGRTVLDLVRAIAPPFSPAGSIETFAAIVKAYGVTSVTGDRWGGEFPAEKFRELGIAYEICAHAKSDLYQQLLPRLMSLQVELLDEPKLRAQLAGLERRTGRGGRDSIDHRPGAHDDRVNAAALVLALGPAHMSEATIRAIWQINDDSAGLADYDLEVAPKRFSKVQL